MFMLECISLVEMMYMCWPGSGLLLVHDMVKKGRITDKNKKNLITNNFIKYKVIKNYYLYTLDY